MGVLLKTTKLPTEPPTQRRLHRALWKRIRKRLDQSLTSVVTRQILVNYIDHHAYEGFERDNWDIHDGYLSFSFYSHGDDDYMKYASFHWTSRAIYDVFTDLQAIAQKHGAELQPKKRWSPDDDVYYFDGDALICVDQDSVRTVTPTSSRAIEIDESPRAAYAKQLLAEQRCLCELCRDDKPKEPVVTSGALLDVDGVPLLVLHFAGQYVGEGDAKQMAADIEALLAEHPTAQCFVLDATELSYTGGKGLGEIGLKGRVRGWVMSDKSSGLVDFIKVERKCEPKEWIFSSLDEAIETIQARAIAEMYEIHDAEGNVTETVRRVPRGRCHSVTREEDGEPRLVDQLADLYGNWIEIVWKLPDGTVEKIFEYPNLDALGNENAACKVGGELTTWADKSCKVDFNPNASRRSVPTDWVDRVAANPAIEEVSLDKTSVPTVEILQLLERCPQLEGLYLNCCKVDAEFFSSPLLGTLRRLQLHDAVTPPGAIAQLAALHPWIDIQPPPPPFEINGHVVDADGVAIFVVSFVGFYDTANAATMKGACDALLIQYPDVKGIVLDATNLVYATGKEIGEVLAEGRPFVWAVSESSRGLFRFIRVEQNREPREWLFPSVAAAIAAVRAQVVADSYEVHDAKGNIRWHTWRKEPRGRRRCGRRVIDGVEMSDETLFDARGRVIEDLYRRPEGTLERIYEWPIRDDAGGENDACRMGAKLSKLDGKLVTIEYGVELTNRPLPADWVERIAAHRETVTCINLDGTGATTADIVKVLERCPKIDRLWLNSLSLDAEFFAAPQLANVKILWIWNTTVPPGAVKALHEKYPSIDINPKEALA